MATSYNYGVDPLQDALRLAIGILPDPYGGGTLGFQQVNASPHYQSLIWGQKWPQIKGIVEALGAPLGGGSSPSRAPQPQDLISGLAPGTGPLLNNAMRSSDEVLRGLNLQPINFGFR